MRARQAEVAAAGAALVVVGNGTPAMARAFAAGFAADVAIATDPERALFAAAGMRRGLRTVLRWSLLPNLLRALRAGHRQARVQGDAWQQGGLLVLDAGGRERHAQRDDAAGAPLDLDAALAALPAAP